MSIDLVNKVLDLPTAVNGTNRMVLLVLADFAGPDGVCFPKVETIARRAGIARMKTVRASLAWLEFEGLITRQINGFAGIDFVIPPGKRPNVYVVKLPWVGGRKVTPQGGRNPTTQGGAESDHQKRHLEPSVEPTTSGDPSDAVSAVASQQSFLDEPESVADPKKGAAKTKAKRSTRNAAALLSEGQRAMFEAWWSQYPVKKRKADAMAAWVGAMDVGLSSADLTAALEHYVESIAGWEARAGVKLEFIFAAPKFIDGAYLDFVDGPDSARWPLPKREERVEVDDFSDMGPDLEARRAMGIDDDFGDGSNEPF